MVTNNLFVRSVDLFSHCVSLRGLIPAARAKSRSGTCATFSSFSPELLLSASSPELLFPVLLFPLHDRTKQADRPPHRRASPRFLRPLCGDRRAQNRFRLYFLTT